MLGNVMLYLATALSIWEDCAGPGQRSVLSWILLTHTHAEAEEPLAEILATPVPSFLTSPFQTLGPLHWLLPVHGQAAYLSSRRR